MHRFTPLRPASVHRWRSLALATLLLVAATSLSSPALQAAEEPAVAEGTWTKKSFAISGTWRILRQGDDLVLELDGDFKTRKAPDLKLFLAPRPLAQANGGNATDGSLLIAPLESPRGAQTYRLPRGTDLGAYGSLLLHCERYAKLWGGADLP